MPRIMPQNVSIASITTVQCDFILIKKNPLQIAIFLFLCVIPKRLKVFQTVDLLCLQGCYRLVVNFIVENMTKLGIGILGVVVVWCVCSIWAGRQEKFN